MTTESKSCLSCVFWEPEDLSCRRYPPVLSHAQVYLETKSAQDPASQAIDEASTDICWYWPATNADDWCGEWRKRE